MSGARYLSEDGLTEFLAALAADRTFVNAWGDAGTVWSPHEETEASLVTAGLRGARPFNSFKSVLLPAREVVARYGSEEQPDPLAEAAQVTAALVGVRGCECRALGYLDAVMFGEPVVDPFYHERRENTTIVSVDCVCAAPTCFCDLLGEEPYAQDLFDVNLSPVPDGYVAEAGTEKGRGVLERAGLPAADESRVAQRDAGRLKTADQLREQNAEYAFPEGIEGVLPKTVEEAFWQGELSGCVQCGGCAAVCPTCYCFALYDRTTGPGQHERVRVWDCCQFTGYAVMAGPPGGPKPDPRRRHMSKFQHRFAHKFCYDPARLGVLGCVGCGRCAQTCPGAVDLRRVLSQVKTGGPA